MPQELARYSISAGERMLYAEADDSALRIVDRPVGEGRSYVVEEQLEKDGCAALVSDYIQQAVGLDTVPMASGALDQILQVATNA